ncbi:hypothetical protein DAPPUDRAFT_241842 [Daphnia pulex]|uniref:Uncharacterized protein n=1 Tax=Daphnia pulex TaxID=6669 RepID=E9GF76_DAPPU|nr:hypothetical protein DAPPUDRAFT_241842 [Daphnia pulex]|eukprot:EFX81858.1 hypothetical protein DAPPUDRAFT_241842 [Daphnia pulex]
MDSLWEGVRESVYNNFLSKQAYPFIFQSPVLNPINRGSINRSQYSWASKEYEFLIYTVEEKIKRLDKTTCKACAGDPLSCHIDGNMKLLRWLTAKGLASKSLYGDAVITSDSDLNDFVAVVDSTKKTKSTSSESCGGSTFKAAKSYSSQCKNLDETGVVMGCCRHGVILWIGHWMDNAALTTGEEQEQVFSKMLRYNSVTKHMGKASYFSAS